MQWLCTFQFYESYDELSDVDVILCSLLQIAIAISGSFWHSGTTGFSSMPLALALEATACISTIARALILTFKRKSEAW